MGIFSFLKKKPKQTTTDVAPKTTAVRSIDFGQTTESGGTQRVGGTKIYGSGAWAPSTKVNITKSGGGGGGGGGGGEVYNVEVTGENISPTPDKSFKAPTSKPFFLNTGTLQPYKSDFARGTSQTLAPQKNIPVYFEPYLSRTDPTLKGYTTSGKKVYSAGTPMFIDPFADKRFGGDRPATASETAQLESYEKSIGFSPTPDIKYNPEDRYSYGELNAKGKYDAILRKGAYDFWGSLSAGASLAYNKLSGKRIGEGTQAKIRSIGGEASLFGFFSPAMTTTTQTYASLAKPAKIKELGVYERTAGGKIAETDIIFKASKGGTTYTGIARGQAGTFQIGNTNKFISAGKSLGIAGQKALTPSGVRLINTQAFATREMGIGVIKGNNFFTSAFWGKIGGATAKGAKYSSKYEGVGFQFLGDKGIATFAGRSSSKYGIAQYGGFAFPTAQKSIIRFIPLGAKGGQMALSVPKTIISNAPISIARAGALTLTRSSIGAFGSTLAPVSSLGTTSLVGVGLTTTKFITPFSTSVSRKSYITPQSSSLSFRQQLGVKGLSAQSTAPAQTNRFRGSQFSAPFSATKSIQVTKQVNIQKQISLQKNIRLVTPAPINFRFRTGEPPPFAFNLNGSALGLSSNTFKGGKRRVGYTPSFSAIVFNVRGRYKTKGLAKTGLNFRPITRGYSFPTGLARKGRKRLYVF